MGEKFRFDGWAFDPASGDLERGGTCIRLQEQPALVLRDLLARPGDVVTREELVQRLWPKGVVDFDAGLNTIVRKLRSALQDGADAPRYIETLPRRGYRFIGTLELAAAPGLPAPAPMPPAMPDAAAAPRPRWRIAVAAIAVVALGAVALAWWRVHAGARSARATPAPAPAVAASAPRVLAVLPFANLSPNEQDAYLAEGLYQEVLDALAIPHGLQVLSRSTAAALGSGAALRDGAHRLGVGWLLQGSVRRDGNTVRLTVQLEDVAANRQVFAANYDRPIDHLLGMQAEVAQEVTQALLVTLDAYERHLVDRVGTTNGDAYRHYLAADAALYRLGLPGYDGILRDAEEAVRLDPSYAEGWALVAQARCWRYFRGGRKDDAEPARVALERAAALDPALPSLQLARGLYEMYVRGDPARAESFFAQAIRHVPSQSVAHLVLGYAQRRQGKQQQAIAAFQRSWDLDPLNTESQALDHLLDSQLAQHQYADVYRTLDLARQRMPTAAWILLMRTELDNFSKGDLQPLRTFVQEGGKGLDPVDLQVARINLAWYEHRLPDMVALAQSFPVPPDNPFELRLHTAFWQWNAGQAGPATRLMRELRQELQASGGKMDESNRFLVIALIDSALGEHGAALAAIERTCQLAPEDRDATNGPAFALVRALLLVRAGQDARGYAELERLRHVPNAVPYDWFGGDISPTLILMEQDPRFHAVLHDRTPFPRAAVRQPRLTA